MSIEITRGAIRAVFTGHEWEVEGYPEVAASLNAFTNELHHVMPWRSPREVAEFVAVELGGTLRAEWPKEMAALNARRDR